MVRRQVLYVAHPLAPTEAEIAAQVHNVDSDAFGAALSANIDRALRWLAWLRASFPETTFIAPWIAEIMANDGHEDRHAGMVDNCAVVERCDGIVLCGGRISSGMRTEAAAGRFPDHWACDLIGLGAEPPSVASDGRTFAAYVDWRRRGTTP